jgi:hypothetical protein
MAFDSHSNLAYSAVATAPSPATSGTSLVVTAGQGALFPTPPFNAVVCANGALPITTNSEIVRVTGISTNTLTITRAQEGTSARTIVVGDQIFNAETAKVLTDIEGNLPQGATTNKVLKSNGTSWAASTETYAVPGTSGNIMQSNGTDWNSTIQDGWITNGSTLTYSSADSPTFVATTSIDLTSYISLGDKIKLTQTTVKYFICTAITNSTITLYGGTDYTLVSAAITAFYYSHVRSPFGFPLLSTKWSVAQSDSGTIRSQATPTDNTWYELYTGLRPVIPIGMWIPKYSVKGQLNNTSPSASTIFVTLSTSSATESSIDNTSSINGNTVTTGCSQFFEKDIIPLVLTTKTTFYLNTKCALGTGGPGTIYNRADDLPTRITFTCGYL